MPRKSRMTESDLHFFASMLIGVQLVVVTPEDYILGMSDLTGELMRYATNGAPALCRLRRSVLKIPQCLIWIALSTGDHVTPLAVCDFVRTVKICGSTPSRTRRLG